MNRRDAVRVVAGIAGILWGTPAVSSSQSQQRQSLAQGQGIRLVLDGQDFVEVVYKGQRAQISPQEIIDALKR